MKLIAQLGQIKGPTTAFDPKDLTPAGVTAPIGKIFSTIVGFLTILAGLYFLIYFIVAALNWISSGGDKGKVESARSQMTNAALGLAIVVAAYGIIGIVGGVFGVDILNPGKVIQSIQPK